MRDIKNASATGLQIARDPSTPVVYLGCFLLFAGIGIAFYTSHKRIWAHAASGRVAALSSRTYLPSSRAKLP